MHWRAFFAAWLAAILLLCAPARAGQVQDKEAADPQAFINQIYHHYVGDNAKGIDLSEKDVPTRYFTPATAALVLADQNEAETKGEVGRLDWDIFVNSQDWLMERLPKLKTVLMAPDSATVQAIAVTEGQDITFQLVKTKDGWRIDDILWEGTTETLVKLLKQPL